MMRHAVKRRDEVARRAYCVITNLWLSNLIRNHSYQKVFIIDYVIS